MPSIALIKQSFGELKQTSFSQVSKLDKLKTTPNKHTIYYYTINIIVKNIKFITCIIQSSVQNSWILRYFNQIN